MSASRNQDPRAAGRIHLVIPAVIAALIFAVALFFLESEQAGPGLPELDELDSLTDLDTVPDAVDASTESASQTQSVVSEAVDATADHGPTRGIHGLVRNAMTLDPLADAHIELRRLSANWAGGDRGVVTRARSDDDGRFVLEMPGEIGRASCRERE